jgi:hypothetical protein
LLYAEGIIAARGPQSVAHDLLHGFMNVQIIEAVPHACLPSEVTIRGHEGRIDGIVGVEIFDNDGRLCDRAIARLIAQYREFCHRPQRPEFHTRFLVSEIDNNRVKRDVVFVERDKHLVAIGRRRMEIEL